MEACAISCVTEGKLICNTVVVVVEYKTLMHRQHIVFYGPMSLYPALMFVCCMVFGRIAKE